MTYDVHAVARAFEARGNGLGHYLAYCPVCQTTPEERRKGRKFGFAQGRKQPFIYNCFRGCDHRDLRDAIDEVMAKGGVIQSKPEVYVANVRADSEEARRRLDIVQCIAEQDIIPAHEATPARLYLESKGITKPVHSMYYCESIVGAEGLRIPETDRPCIIVICRRDGKPVGGQRILIKHNGERATNYAGAKFAKFAFGFLRGNPYRTTMYAGAITKALMVTESAETAAVLHEATDGGETWAVFGVSNFKTIPLTDPPIPRTRPIIFFPDLDPFGSAAYNVMRDAMEYHGERGYSVFSITPPEQEGSKRNFTDTCERGGMAYVRQVIKSEIDKIKRGPA